MCEASPEEAELIAEDPSRGWARDFLWSVSDSTVLESIDAAQSPEELQAHLTNTLNEFFSCSKYLLLTGRRSGFSSKTLKRFF